MTEANIKIDIPYGKSKLSFEIPKKNLIEVVRNTDTQYEINEEEEIKKALKNPIGSKRLSYLSSKAKNAVILVSDITRPCPSYKFLPFILEEISNIELKNITIVFGLGIHRRHSKHEQKKLIGDDLSKRVNFMDFDETDCKFLGYTSKGTPIEVFRPYLDAYLKICTGNIEYHYFAGYSGGAKAVMPGISSRRAIEHNHSMMLKSKAQASVIEGNPVREDIEEVGKAVGIDFIFNVILNDKKEIIKAVCGNYMDAFIEGTKIYDKLKRCRVKELADIIVTSPGGYPKDINLYQSQKALENVKGAVKKGGAIILVAKCQDGMGEDTFEKWMLEMKSPDILIEKIKKKFVLGGHKASAIANLLKKVDIYLISSISKDYVKRIELKPVESIDKAIKMAFNKLGSNLKLIVAPNGEFLVKDREYVN